MESFLNNLPAKLDSLVLMNTSTAERETDRNDAGAEGHVSLKGDDGDIILIGVGVIAGMPHEGGRCHAKCLETGTYFFLLTGA